ncbi:MULTISPECIES: STAS domain-containing protein [Pacificibacter]|uniref:STAS domain-containing protein n=1 Tax=Pacificibacter TaxID=1042323 RepID=UPI001C099F8A|nr:MULTISPECIES: STAS domain-containing protein [Pacificibacter]MBU2937633.1 STAS domain-containing protein [Pacificibacter marinus]MDO6616928.1 STAS domain-containing protein [Pacificibacter sp. 1_MG-2023]
MIHTSKYAPHIVVVRPGVERLTAINSKAFKEEVIALIEGGASQLVIDFKEVSFLDSSGLGALTGVLKRIGHRGDLVVCGLNSDVTQMFKICRMDRVFKSYLDVDAAVQAMSESL